MKTWTVLLMIGEVQVRVQRCWGISSISDWLVWPVRISTDFGFLSVQSGIYSVQTSLQLSAVFFPYNTFWRVCPCTSRKPKSDKLLKSLGVVWKTSPRESLNASGFFDWWFRMTWKLLTGTSLIECLIWLPETQGDTKCGIWMRDFLLVINFMQSRLQTFSSSSLIH